MAFKTYAQLATTTTFLDADLIATYSGSGPLKAASLTNFYANYVAGKVFATSGHFAGYLDGANTWSGLQAHSLNTAVTALDYIALKPTDYATGKPGLFFSKDSTAANWTIQLFDGTNNAGTLNLKAGTVALTGVMTLSGALTPNAGVVQTGSTKQSVTAISALNLDLSTNDFFTKSISTNSTFTFSNATASVAQAFALQLTISSSAVPTWPAAVKWSSGVAPSLPNGVNLLGFITFDGGTTWIGIPAATAVA